MSIQARESHQIVEFTSEKKELLRKTLCKSLTSNNEMELFLHTCTRLGLDPFLKQIYAVKRGDTMTIQTGIDGYRLIAERSGRYMPGKEPSFAYDKEGRLFSATSYVKKLGPDNQWHEIACTAIYTEYAPIYQGKVSGMWKDKGHLMLAKCAESAALRRAFPAEMSGVYTDDEMEQADNQLNKHTGEINKMVEVRGPTISKVEAQIIEGIIGDDTDYQQRILDHYGVKTLSDIEHKHHDLILSKAKAFRDEKVRKEMETV